MGFHETEHLETPVLMSITLQNLAPALHNDKHDLILTTVVDLPQTLVIGSQNVIRGAGLSCSFQER